MTLVRWALLALVCVPGPAMAQALTLPCYQAVGGAGCVPVSAANPLPTTGGGGGGGGNVTVIGPLGQSNKAGSLPVTIASDQGSTTVIGTGTFATQSAQSGTWTVQPGNTANTTAWLVTGTGGAFPATQSTASNLNATVVGNGTFAVQAASSANVTATDCSGTVTTGGTAQNAFTAQTTLHGFTIANIDATTGSGEPMWVSFTTTAASSTTGSYPLSAPTATTYAGLSSYTAPPGFGLNHALSVFAATTGHKFSCTYY